jgi:phosphopantothenoylcysteine decarboxylase/phosphopantothenate--cysteine ligase
MKRVILGVSGGIAAYKAAELARLFIKQGTDVRVVMTPAAVEFITPLTFQTLTGNPVYKNMFDGNVGAAIPHIDLLDQVELLVVAPATANTIGKMASGLADNLLTTLYLAATCPTVIVPSMNVNMYGHRAVQENVRILKEQECHILDPDSGELACGVYGRGRMPEPVDILAFCRSVLVEKDFQGVKAIVTAGPTREHLDPVRFLTNPSTGLMGYTLARALHERGAEVVLVSGPTYLDPPMGVKTVSVTTAEEMRNAVLGYYNSADLVIKAAAVSDYRPAEIEEQKVKKDRGSMKLDMVLNRDILLELGRNKGSRTLVGFAAETEHTIEHAHEKLIKKNLDMIIANDLSDPGAGFAVKTNRVSIIDREGSVEVLPLMEKEELSHLILDRVAGLLNKR